MGLESRDKTRIVGAAALAVLVMGGVVALALQAGGDADADRASSLPAQAPYDPNHPFGRSRADRHVEIPPDCKPDPVNPPTIAFDLPLETLDFGLVKEGVVLEKDVTLRNVGRGVLCIVAGPKTGCGCVKAELVGPNRIPPGETSAIRVKVDTKGREGPQDKLVKVWVNDPSVKDGMATFHVRCDVQLGILVATPVLRFREVAKGKTGLAPLRLKCPKAAPEWHVTAIEGMRGTFTFEEKPVETTPTDPFRVVDVWVTFGGSAEMGVQSDTLRVRTTNPDRPEFLVPAEWTIVTKWFARPPRIPFGFVGGEAGALPFHLLVGSADPERSAPLLDAKVEGRGFEVGKPEKQETGEWRVTLKALGDRVAPGPMTGTLVLTFDDAEQPEVRVPLTATAIAPRTPPSPPK
jgi:hypothetical protein